MLQFITENWLVIYLTGLVATLVISYALNLGHSNFEKISTSLLWFIAWPLAAFLFFAGWWNSYSNGPKDGYIP